MRLLSIDYGKKRIGIAITDMSKTICYPCKTIQAEKTLVKTVDHLLKEIDEYLKEIETIIIGLPYLIDGSESEMTKEVRKFADILKTRISIPLVFVDERLSSYEAEQHLKENLKLSRKKRSKSVDPIAAVIILQDYLEITR